MQSLSLFIDSNKSEYPIRHVGPSVVYGYWSALNSVQNQKNRKDSEPLTELKLSMDCLENIATSEAQYKI